MTPAFLLAFIIHATAQESSTAISAPIAQKTKTETSDLKKNTKIIVTDTEDDFFLNAVSPHRVSKDKVGLYNYTDTTRALKQSAGVYTRDEDGQGLRPNIGLRGTNPDRSKKVVFLEDDILIGPAPYSAPAAYYTPSMNHTESIDIYKGFTAVPYGPNSIGGSINYLTTTAGAENQVRGSVSAGAFNTQNHKLSGTAAFKKSSLLIEASRLSSDGFKVIDGGGDAGFEKNEILMKYKHALQNLDNQRQHYLEARVGYSDEDSNETYLGLGINDINASPFRRYASSALDKMEWQHSKLQLEHVYDISTSSRIKTSVYRHDFERNWLRLDRFSSNTNPSLFNVLANTSQNSLLFGVLNGTVDSADANGNLLFLGNQRTFYSQGVQTRWNTQWTLGATAHDTEVGLRFHQDQIRRTHSRYTYEMRRGQLASLDLPSPETLNRNRATALTAHFAENMAYDKWVFTVLGRVESVRFNFDEYLVNNNFLENSLSRTESAFAPGAAVLYKWTPSLSSKLSINRGVSLSGLSDRGTERPEESINYELGVKYIAPTTQTQAEFVAFYNDYSNITGTCTGSTGCSSTQLDLQFNGGAALVQGLEGRIAQQFQIREVAIPVQFNMTFLNAEFRNTFTSETAEWGRGTVRTGDPLPYIPQIQYTLSLGTNYKSWQQEFAFIYQGETMDQSVRENRLEIPAFGIIDWTGRYQISKKAQVFARIDNLLAQDYLVTYRPFGARPGKPQSFMAGLNYTF